MKLSNQHVSLEVQKVAAGITDVKFTLPDGTIAEPFFQNPWRLDAASTSEKLPVLLRHLPSEWPCVPFGTQGRRRGLPGEWTADDGTDIWNTYDHGYSSHHEWNLKQNSGCSLTAEIKYPRSSPVSKLVRTIRLDTKKPEIHFSLRIEVRHATRLPVGLHPIFDLSDCQPGKCRLLVGGKSSAWTLPVDLEPESIFAAGLRETNLKSIALKNGKAINASHIPFECTNEDLLMLTEPNGEIRLEYLEKGYSTILTWDAQALPSCVLWFSNGGRKQYPWNGRVRAIGIEPVAAAFDLGASYSDAANSPLMRAGIVNGIDLDVDDTWMTNYSVSLEPLQDFKN